MSGKMITPVKNVEQMILADVQRREQAIIATYCYIGEYCVKVARDGGTYKDRTGNLRSSIGYVVLNNSIVVKQGSFEQIKSGNEGVKEGNKFLQKLKKKSEYRNGIVFIMSAGMNYSAKVEAKGYDVLTLSELQAKELANQMLSDLGFKIL